MNFASLQHLFLAHLEFFTRASKIRAIAIFAAHDRWPLHFFQDHLLGVRQAVEGGSAPFTAGGDGDLVGGINGAHGGLSDYRAVALVR
jgi:hypothetical protein